MIKLERRKLILEILEKGTDVSTQELIDRLGVTGATIRSDLREMQREGAIVRYHGGARLTELNRSSSPNENYMRRSVMMVAEKSAIGKAAAAFVSDGQTIFIDASSTAFHMIEHIRHLDNLTVVTNGIHTAMEVQRIGKFRTVIIGGVLRPHSGAIEGLLCEEMLRRISADAYFVSGNGFSAESGLTGHNFYELELKKLCAEKCKRVVVMVDSGKLNSDSTSTFIAPEEISVLITDSGIDEATARKIKAVGIQLVIAPIGA